MLKLYGMFNVIYWVRPLKQLVLQNTFEARLSLMSPKQNSFYSFFLLFTSTRFPTHTSKISTLLANETSTWSKVHCRIKIQMPLHSLCCAEECNEFTGPSLSHIAPKNNTVGEMLQQRRAVGTTASNSTNPRFEPQASCIASSNYKFTSCAYFWSMLFVLWQLMIWWLD